MGAQQRFGARGARFFCDRALPASWLSHRIDLYIAEPYIAFASTRSADPRLAFLTGDAVALDSGVGSFDRCLSLLALNFMTDPIRAFAGMRGVTRPGGVVAAAFEAGGLRSVEPASLSIRMEYTGLSDYWEPVANAQGPVGRLREAAHPTPAPNARCGRAAGLSRRET